MTPRHIFSVFDVGRQGTTTHNKVLISVLRISLITRHSKLEATPARPCVPLPAVLTPDVLIISKRNVPRLSDLEPREVSDLFQSVQRVGRMIEKAYKAEALNIALQVCWVLEGS